MPINTSIEMIDQATFDQFEATLLNLVRTHHPTLDVRKGTALRDLLISKAAELAAINSGNYDHLTKLMTLEDNAIAGASAADLEIVDSVLTNLGVRRSAGTAATGRVIVYVDVLRDYYLPAGVVFSNGDNTYSIDAAIAVNGTGDTAAEYRVLPSETAGTYYFVVPAASSVIGAAYNLPEGTELSVSVDLGTGVVGASVYEELAGGTDAETLDALIARLPQSVAYRSLVSTASISATLRAQFPVIKDLAVIGMGDAEMLRDKHNVFANAVGSRVDVYVRTGYEPEQVVLELTGVKVVDGTYVMTIGKDDVPGFYQIVAVTDTDSVMSRNPDNPDNSFTVTGSMHPFTEVRTAEGLADTFHDFATGTDAQVIETAYTRWQAAVVTVSEVPAAATGTWPSTRDFKLVVYRPVQLDDIQDFVDDSEQRNQESDCVVRGAVPCFVRASIPVYRSSGVVLDTLAMRTAIVDMINRLPFGTSLTMSQLASLLHTFDIVRVGLDIGPGEFELNGTIRAADGSTITLSGNAVNLEILDRPEVLVTRYTTALMTTLNDISIAVRTA